MSRYKVMAGDRIIEGEVEYLVREIRDGLNIIVEDVFHGIRMVLSKTELEKAFLEGRAKLKKNRDGSAEAQPPFDLLPDQDKTEAKRRRDYVLEVERVVGYGPVRSFLGEVIEHMSVVLKDPNPPSEPTLYRWLRIWRESNNSIHALVPKYKKRGRRGQKLSDEEIKLLMTALRDKYLVLEQPTLVSVMPDICAYFEEENKQRGEDDQLKIPSDATVYRFVQNIAPFERTALREGKHIADRKFRMVGKGLVVDAPLDCVQIDHTVLDIQVLAPVDGFVARPRLTVAMDLYSRMPIGIYVGFIPAGYESLALCLRNGILPKDNLLTKWSSINGDWPCYGLPRKILVDNGAEFHSESLLDACATLGIGIVNHPVREPHYKGVVERFFRSINDSLLCKLKGKTFSNVVEKGDYDSVAKACIPFHVFEETLMKWVVDVYARKFHRGIQNQPIDQWNEGVLKHPVDLMENSDDLLILLSEKKPRKLTRKGIEIHNTFYNSAALNDMLHRMGRGHYVRVKRDPHNLGSIYVFDEERERYLKVACINEDMEGLTLWEHKLLRIIIANKKRAGEAIYNSTKHLNEIWQVVSGYSEEKKQRSNARVARLAEYQNQKPTASDQPEKGKDKALETPYDNGKDYQQLISEADKRGWRKLQDGDEVDDV